MAVFFAVVVGAAVVVVVVVVVVVRGAVVVFAAFFSTLSVFLSGREEANLLALLFSFCEKSINSFSGRSVVVERWFEVAAMSRFPGIALRLEEVDFALDVFTGRLSLMELSTSPEAST